MANKIRIDAELVTQVSNLGETTKQIENSLNNLKFDFGKDKSFQKLFKNFESELLNFKSLTKDGEIDLLDEKKVEKSGNKIIQIFNQIVERQKEIASSSTSEKMKLFPDGFVKNADKAVSALDGFLAKYKEFGNTSTNLDTAKNELKKYQAQLDEATEKLEAFGGVRTKGQAWKEQERSVKAYEQSLDSVIKKSAEANANKKNTRTTNNEDYNNLTRLIQL